ncbi:MAG: asparagine synthase (glutamine-hydrolyzing) [Hyphomicrobium sp.]
MCGFAGFIDFPRAHTADSLERIVNQMGNAIAHRGPDDSQSWTDAECGVALAFRRLAILDLSPAGRQPMHSRSGRYVIVFNGEIYNAPSLKAKLGDGAAKLRGHSDTEVLVELIDKIGFKACMPLLRGMFAIACWDRRDRVLRLARDPMGKKPVYFGFVGRSFVFGSQPNAFLAFPQFQSELDRDAMCAFFRFGYIPAPHSIYQGIDKLRPGESLEIKDGRILRRTKFWEAAEKARAAAATAPILDDADAIDQLESLIERAVDRRLASDVPLGAYLSGGIDSSTVLAIMRARAAGTVKSFCIGFGDTRYDESRHAEEIANYLQLEHHTLHVGPEDLLNAVFDMPQVYDEPFADPSQVPTYILSRLTRGHVTVALSGDGGDELFSGYTRYQKLEKICRMARRIPSALKPGTAQLIRTVPKAVWNSAEAVMQREYGQSPLAARALKFADVLQSVGPELIYRDLIEQWSDPSGLVIGGREPVDPIWMGALGLSKAQPARTAQLLDVHSYLPEDILVKVDRASMAVGLEVRAPLLDQDIAEFAWGLQRNQLVRDGVGKWLLRQVLYRHIPSQLVDRPKMGFAFPLREWLGSSLRDWAEDLLDPAQMAAAGYLNPAPVQAMWKQHLSGTRDWSYRLWCVLMFEAWRRRLPVAKSALHEFHHA